MQTPGRKGLAVTDRASHLRLWLTVGVGFALDLASKYAAWHWLGGPPHPKGSGHVFEFLPGVLRFECSQNPGVVFGLNFTEDLAVDPVAGRILTVLLTVATSALIFYLFAVSRPRQRWMHLWCGLILAGALGNLYDRLLFGYVRDFIQIAANLRVGNWVLGWPYIFNVADVYLVVGVVAVAVAYTFGSKPEQAEDPASPSREGAKRGLR